MHYLSIIHQKFWQDGLGALFMWLADKALFMWLADKKEKINGGGRN